VIPVLEIGGSHVTAAWVRPGDWQVSGVYRAELHPYGSAAELIAEFAAAAATLNVASGSHWGIAIPGPFDYDAGIGQYAGVAKFDSLAGVDVRSALTAALPHPPGSISFLNDASAFLVGEWLIGAARGVSRSAGITLGTGIGSAFLNDGVIVAAGPTVPPYGEVHLLTHAGRPLEDWVSGRAISHAYRGARADIEARDIEARDIESGDIESGDIEAGDVAAGALEVREIAERARAGDLAAAAVFDDAFALLGEIIGPWLPGFGAQLLVVGGSMSRSWDLIGSPLRQGLLRSSSQPVELRLATHPDAAPLVGAAYRTQRAKSTSGG
jgi:glucokinase